MKARDPQYEIVEEQPQRRLVTRIADKSLPYGGSWTIDLAPENSGTREPPAERRRPGG